MTTEREREKSHGIRVCIVDKAKLNAERKREEEGKSARVGE